MTHREYTLTVEKTIYEHIDDKLNDIGAHIERVKA